MSGSPNHQVRRQNRSDLCLCNGRWLFYFSDHLYRYGAAARRGAVRSLCWANDALPTVMITAREHDPNYVCKRRPKGQITCPELSCDQCETHFLNLTSFTNHIVVGAVGALITYNVHLFDRHAMLSRHHGLILPSDIDWREMEHTPTGMLTRDINVTTALLS